MWINNVVRRDLIIHANLNSLARVDGGEKRLVAVLICQGKPIHSVSLTSVKM